MCGRACGIFERWLQRACAASLGRGLTGGSRHFKKENPNRQITADGASNDADMSHSSVRTTWPITEKQHYRRQGCLWVPPNRDRGRAGCSCERVPANKRKGDWVRGVQRGDGRAKNRCGDRRSRVGWAAMGTGVGM